MNLDGQSFTSLESWPYSFPPMAGGSGEGDDGGASGDPGGAQSTPGEGGGDASKPAAGEVSRGFFDRLLGPFRAADDPKSDVSVRRAATEAQAGSGDEGAGAASGEKKPDAAAAAAKASEGNGQDQPFKVYATKEEWEEDARRAGQAESDRRDAVRATKAANEARLRLRTEDPDEYARQDALREEGTQVATSIAGQVIDVYDTQILQPLLSRLPEDKRAEVLSTINSVDTRRGAAEAVLKHIEDDAYARGMTEGEKKAQAKLRENPAVRKELLSTLRADGEGLEAVEGTGASAAKPDMNAFLRRGAGLR